MAKCPFCFLEVSNDYFSYICGNSHCGPEADIYAAAFTGLPEVLAPVRSDLQRPSGDRRWRPPAAVACRKCKVATSDQVCPRCHYRLPPDWRSSRSVHVALAGARSTGKSIYLAVAVKQLELMLKERGVTMGFGSKQSSDSYYAHYYRPLYEAGGIVESTRRAENEGAPQRHPVVLSLGIDRGVRSYLVLRDAAGEELQDLRDGRRGHLGYFSEADAVMFMFDPTAEPAVAHMLHDHVQVSGPRDRVTPSSVLTNVIQLCGTERPPIAVVLSKFDTLHELANIDAEPYRQIMSNQGAAMNRDPGFRAQNYDPRDGELLSEELRSLLITLDADAIVNQLAHPHDGKQTPHQYFAVSALGGDTTNDNRQLNQHGIAPFRCLDPLRWALSQSNPHR